MQKDDVIYRQAAIDAISCDITVTGRQNAELVAATIGAFADRIKTLPSAQPEERTDKHTETHACDSISRQAAIDAVRQYCIDNLIEDCDYHSNGIEYELNNLPSAEPERKKGKWIDYTEDGYVECPFCHSATNCDGNKAELHFCFWCGADMRGGEDGK